jgi:hypothetical protein
MAVEYNIVIDQGADWFLNVTYQNPNGTAVDLDGYTAAMQVRSFPQSPTAVLTLTTDEGIVITGNTGLISLHATNEQTAIVDEGNYYYDLEITDPMTSIITRLIQGQAVVSAQVTR